MGAKKPVKKINPELLLNEVQKDALREVYDEAVQSIHDAVGMSNYNSCAVFLNALLKAGNALGFDLYDDWNVRHQGRKQ